MRIQHVIYVLKVLKVFENNFFHTFLLVYFKQHFFRSHFAKMCCIQNIIVV